LAWLIWQGLLLTIAVLAGLTSRVLENPPHLRLDTYDRLVLSENGRNEGDLSSVADDMARASILCGEHHGISGSPCSNMVNCVAALRRRGNIKFSGER